MVSRAGSRKVDAAAMMRALRPYLSKHRLSTHKFRPGKSALIVIDMQRYFLDPGSHAYLRDGEAIVENLRKLIDAYREHGHHVIYTRQALREDQDPKSMARWWKDNLREGEPLSVIDDRLAPKTNEEIITKSQYSAFVGTNLERILRARKVSSILVAGVMTHLCCESTARDAFMRGFDVFFVIDGTASRDKDLHISSLKTLTDGFAIPITVSEVMRSFTK